MSLWAILLTGLFAGGASCAAVQGGLLAGLVARRSGQPTPAMAGNDPRTQPAPTTPADDKSKATSRRTPPEQPAATQPNPPRPKALGGIDDLLPVGGFLTGKLISHVLLGAALGAVGSAVQLTPRTRATVQIVAGVVMLVLAPKLDVEASLPETGEIVLDLGTLKPGKLRFSCGMGMYSGSIQVT